MSFRTRVTAIVHRLTGRRLRDLQTALTVARQAVAEMSLVKPPEPDGHYEAGGERFYRSSFNTAWLAELAVAPQAIVDVGSYDAGDAVRFKLTFPHARVFAF